MTRRRLLLALGVAFCLAALLALSLRFLRKSPAAAALNRVHLGMTQEEAAAVLGPPFFIDFEDAGRFSSMYDGGEPSGARIVLDYEEGRVSDKRLIWPQGKGWLQELRDWLGW